MLEKFKSIQEKVTSGQSFQTDSTTIEQGEITSIGETISIEGAISGKGNLVIQGNMKGTIDLSDHQLTVGSQGAVEAEIQAEKVVISGGMKGNVTASGKVELTKEADFVGEIRAKTISVEDGAYMKAMIELEKRPGRNADEQNKPKIHNSSDVKPDPKSSTEKRETGE